MPVAAQYIVTFLKPEMLHIYRQIRALQEFKPFVFCQKRENTENFPFDTVRILQKPATHQLRRFFQKKLLNRPITMYNSEAVRLAEELTAARAALIHIYFGHIGLHLIPFLERRSIPSIVSFHGADAGIHSNQKNYVRANHRMFAAVDRVLVRSGSLRESVISLGCPPEKILIHRTGVPLAEIPFVQRTFPPSGEWRFLQACRLIAKKGLETTLRAFAAFLADHPRSQLVIAGEGPLLSSLHELARDLGVANAVRFTGFLSQNALRQEMESAHVFLHPSQTSGNGDREGIPNSLLEAMASGMPVLATKHGGIPEAVEHGVSGLLTAERDYEGLAQSMHSLCDSPSAYETMCIEASRRCREAFDLRSQARLLESIYRACVESTR